MNAKQISLEGFHFRCLVYGKSGVGKTTFASTFPKPYFFDFDRGMVSVRGRDVEYDEYDDMNKAEAKFIEFRSKCPHSTLVFDSVTVMLDRQLERLLQLNNRKEASQYEYGQRIIWLNALFSSFVKLPMNVILVAHEETVKDQLTGGIHTRPLLAGDKLPAKTPLYFDEVYRLSVGRNKENKPVYRLNTVGDERIVAKTRLGMPTVVESPTYQLLMEKLKEKEGGKK